MIDEYAQENTNTDLSSYGYSEQAVGKIAHIVYELMQALDCSLPDFLMADDGKDFNYLVAVALMECKNEGLKLDGEKF